MNLLRRGLIGIISWMVFLGVMGQTKKSFTLEDLIPGGTTNYCLIPENLTALQWWGEEAVYYDLDQEALVSCFSSDAVKVTLQEVNSALEQADLKAVSSLHKISFPDNKRILIPGSGYYAIYENGEISWKVELERKAAHVDVFPLSHKIAYTLDNNLWIADDKAKVQITHEPEGVVCGQSVHRNEFGIHKGTFWSPQGDYLAFYRMDERMVTDYPLVDISTRIATLKSVKYPMAGMTSHEVTVGIYNVQTAETIYLNTGDPKDRYFTNLSWSPDQTKIYIIELNRDQNHAQLVRYDVKTGTREEVILEETHEKYVEPQHPVLFLKNRDDYFIYQSQKDGFNHLYLYNTNGKLIRQLTEGKWLVQGILGFDKKGKNLYFNSTEVSPLESHVYKLNIETGKRTLLTKSSGLHQGLLSTSGNYLIDHYSSPTVARKIEIIATGNGKKVKSLLAARNPYEDYQMPEIEVGTIKAADETTDLYYRLVKPLNFDPTKKYPAIIYVYGGPHAQMVRSGLNWNVRGWDLYMAQEGYVVFTLDNRGGMNRGLEFENVIYRQLGIEEGKDQLQGVTFLKSLPYVDENRVGLHGWSFGGHMTIGLLLRYPGVFKVGVAGGPVVDWAYYEVMYGERYMDTPQTNPDGYEQGNLNNFAGNLQDHLLVIHDDEDATCVLQNTLSFMKACVDAYTFPDLFIYPGHGHNVRGHDRVHLHEKITRYFKEKL